MGNKKLEPTLIIILIILLIIIQTGIILYLLVKENNGSHALFLFLIIPVAIIAGLIAVYRERMKEIDEEDKDDLSRY